MSRPVKHSTQTIDLVDQLLAIRVDKSNPVPNYAQIAEAMRRVLRGCTVPAETELPSERMLCQAYRVSRMTLRQALGMLQREGLIEGRRGRGTFVPLRRLDREQHLASFTEEMRARGAVGSSVVLSLGLGNPSAPAGEFFAREGEPAYRIERLRLADGAPVAMDTVELPQVLCPGLDRFDLVHDSLYRILEEEFGLKLAACVEEISAARPSAAQKRLLQSPRSVAVLMVRRRTLTLDGVPAEFAVTAYRGDLYTAVIRSFRSRQDATYA